VYVLVKYKRFKEHARRKNKKKKLTNYFVIDNAEKEFVDFSAVKLLNHAYTGF